MWVLFETLKFMNSLSINVNSCKDKRITLLHIKSSFFIFLFISQFLDTKAQSVLVSQLSPSAISFRNSMYIFGISRNQVGSAFCAMQLSSTLDTLNTYQIDLGKATPESFLPTQIDTTHGLLKVVLITVSQKSNAEVFLFKENLQLIAHSKNIDQSRMQAISIFEKEKLFFREHLYLSKEAKDSAGKFYLYHFMLRDSSVNMNYKSIWQFNFDQFNYKIVHLLLASIRTVWVYALCSNGTKKGQWILAIDALSSEVKYARKLNSSDSECFMPGKALLFGKDQNLILTGFIFPVENINLEGGILKLGSVGGKMARTSFVILDSTGEVISARDNFLPLPAEIQKEKQLENYMMRVGALKRGKSETFEIMIEFLKKEKSTLYKTALLQFANLKYLGGGMLSILETAIFPEASTKNPGMGEASYNIYDFEKSEASSQLFYSEPTIRSIFPLDFLPLSGNTPNFLTLKKNKSGNSNLISYRFLSKKWESTILKKSTPDCNLQLFQCGTGILTFTLCKAPPFLLECLRK